MIVADAHCRLIARYRFPRRRGKQAALLIFA